ncbi:MAG TPA: tetratricopeptide repeat protein [Mesorhizobium sp.]|jgi:tetratricopeptide (TPR) repeat protein
MRITLRAAALLLALPLLGAPAFAAGGGGGADPTPTCSAGKVWDKKTKKCVTRSSLNDDDSIFENGRALAYAGRYDEAIDVLTMAKDKTDPRILNFLGYAHRKSGRVEVGLGYYQEALRNNPDYTLVREYLGEAHLQLGDVASAREQLSEIEKRCGKGCAEYAELAKQIDAFVKG